MLGDCTFHRRRGSVEQLARLRQPTLTLYRTQKAEALRQPRKYEHRVQHPAKIRSGTKFAEIAVKVLLGHMDMVLAADALNRRPEQMPERFRSVR